jgi:O-antigen/teichoic acid export membrane protein
MNIIKTLKDFFNSKVSKENISELIWVGAGQFINLFFGFGIIKILSKMGTKIFGEYALLLTAAAFLGLTFYGPITQGFTRYYYYYKKENTLPFFIKLIFKVLVYSCIIILMLSLLFSLFMHFYTNSEIFVYILFGVFVTSLKLDEFFNSSLNIIRERKRNSLLQTAEKFLIVVSLFLLLISGKITLIKSITIYSILIIAFIAIKYFYLKKYHKNEDRNSNLINFNQAEKKKMLSTLSLYIYPFLIWGLAGWLQLNGEKWIIAKYLSTSDVGIYAVMMSLINALIVSPNTAISEFVSPIIFQKFSDLGDKPVVREGIKIIILVMIFLSAFIVLTAILTFYLGKDLIILISGKNFIEYFQFLPLLAIGTGLFYLGQAFSFVGLGLNKPQKYLLPKITVGVLSVIFNIYFINVMGISGVVVSILLIGVIYFIYVSVINYGILKDLKISLSK